MSLVLNALIDFVLKIIIHQYLVYELRLCNESSDYFDLFFCTFYALQICEETQTISYNLSLEKEQNNGINSKPLIPLKSLNIKFDQCGSQKTNVIIPYSLMVS